MSNNPIGVCVVGYGYWSPKLIRNIQENPKLTLIAICEKDLSRHDRIRGEQPNIEILQHYRDAFSRDDIHAVVIATIPSSHYRIAKMALEQGKHVLVEKPLTLSVDEGAELLRLSEKKGLVLMVDHTFLYNPAIQILTNLVRKGELGKINSIESVRVNLGLFQRDTNVVWDLAPHDFSILLSLISERPTHVSVIGSKTVIHPKQVQAQESVAHIMLHYSSGLIAHVHVSWISPTKVRQLTVIGSDKVAVFDQLAENQLMVYDQGVYPNEEEGESGPLFIYKTGDPYSIEYDRSGEDLARMILDFANSISTKGAPTSSSRLGLEVVALLQASDRSMQKGGTKTPVKYRNTHSSRNWDYLHFLKNMILSILGK